MAIFTVITPKTDIFSKFYIKSLDPRYVMCLERRYIHIHIFYAWYLSIHEKSMSRKSLLSKTQTIHVHEKSHAKQFLINFFSLIWKNQKYILFCYIIMDKFTWCYFKVTWLWIFVIFLTIVLFQPNCFCYHLYNKN